MTVTGTELHRLFEENLEATFACDPWKQRGGYVKRCRGLELAIKLDNPVGERVQEMRIDGTRVRANASYPRFENADGERPSRLLRGGAHLPRLASRVRADGIRVRRGALRATVRRLSRGDAFVGLEATTRDSPGTPLALSRSSAITRPSGFN